MGRGRFLFEGVPRRRAFVRSASDSSRAGGAIGRGKRRSAVVRARAVTPRFRLLLRDGANGRALDVNRWIPAFAGMTEGGVGVT